LSAGLWFFIYPIPKSVAQSAVIKISGYVTDAETGEPLEGATVFAPTSKKGTATDHLGYYSLSVRATSVRLHFSFTGYGTEVRNFAAGEHLADVALQPAVALKDVEVTASKVFERLEGEEAGQSISVEAIRKLPNMGGEADVLRALQLLPGIGRGQDGSTGLFVRGGSPDQNLILLDGMPLYNVNHLFGFLSVFNPDALDQVTLYKSGIPARFGDRLSSVLAIETKEGNDRDLHGVFSLNPIVGKLQLEGALKKGKSSFIVSGRRSFIGDMVYGLSERYRLYDLNGRFRFSPSKKDALSVVFYSGGDRYQDIIEDDRFRFQWGNKGVSVQWQRQHNAEQRSTWQAYHTDFRHEQEVKGSYNGIAYLDRLSSGIN